MIPVGVVAGSIVSTGVPSAPVFSIDSTSGPIGDPEYQFVYNVSWTVPANNGSAITGYRVERSNDNITWYLLETFNNVTTTASYGYDVGVSDYKRVRAVNAIGIGAPSNALNMGQ